ncbi:CHASE domain-containing protein [Jiella flava]|uniref:histidine kinase n=1 Tax=Jiella flava TaxID=2816857 RepID=A0A939FUM7_9HYPH|nr:CHASE domain-containing protein [Jiella flava]MBO0662258.1 CHASE domain-containing protein [Jiella flava]
MPSIKAVVILAGLYIVFGYLGLLLAVPPDFAVVVWPASGIAIAALLYSGRGLWPGVFLGSFIVNLIATGATTASDINFSGIAIAASIALGSALQADAAFVLVRGFYGIPIRISRASDIVGLAIVAAFIPCLISATISVATLSVAGILAPSTIFDNWSNWYIGDVVGIFAVVPVALLSPWRPWDAIWKKSPITRFRSASLLVLALPLTATFCAWKITSEIAYERNTTSFQALAEDNLQALQHRLASYKQGLDAGAGLFRALDDVSRDEWRRFIGTLELDKTLKGINGIGVIRDVKRMDIPQFLADAKTDGVPNLKIHPQTSNDDLFVIEYIEPMPSNGDVIGLDIAFEANRYAAAIAARDTGKTTITGKITFVNNHKNVGFLLLRPFYNHTMPLDKPQERRAAFRGWIYAPFVNERFFDGLTATQGQQLRLRVYDGEGKHPSSLIFDSNPNVGDSPSATYSMSATTRVMQRHWTLEWDSLPTFDAAVANGEPKLVLAGGLIGTLLLGILLYSLARREEAIHEIVVKKTRELRARGSENRAIIDNAGIGFVVLDDSYHILSINEATCTILGCARRELIGRPVETLAELTDGEGFAIDGDVRERWIAFLDAPRLVSATGTAASKSGSAILLDLQRNQWLAESGERRWTLILRDVTEERRTSNALKTSEKRWNHALQGANIGVFDLDLATNRSFVSETWKTMLGFTADADINPQAERLSRIHPDDLAAVEAADAECLDGRSARSVVEYRIRRADDQWMWMRSDATAIERDADGKALRLIGVQMDVTQLRTAEAALRASRQRFISAVENAPVGMALLDLNGNWLQINGSLCELIGRSQPELRQTAIRELFHPDDEAEVTTLFNRLTESPGSRMTAEYRLVHRDGRIVWCLVGATMVNGGVDTKLPGYIILQFQDITDRKEVERLKSEFVSMVSHELRTPLTSIRGSLGLIVGAQAASLPEKAAKLLRIAYSNCERLIVLINDILDMEKIASADIAFDFDIHDLHKLVTNAVEANQAIFDKGGIGVTIEAAETAPLVRVDADRLHQVLSNLLSNASKFSPNGGKIKISITRSAASATISIADQGSGIPDSFKAKIFSRFSQADSSSTREKGGTGLGLHISKMIVERMDGEISFYNATTGGAVFAVKLPLANPPRRAVTAETAPQATQPEPRLARGLHIEADGDFVEIVRTMLIGEVTLDHAETIAAARKRLAETDYDFYVSDGILPDGSLDKVIGEITARAAIRPVVVLTSSEVETTASCVTEVIVKSRAKENAIVAAIIGAAHAQLAEAS